MNEEQEKEYLKHPLYCPFCKSKKIQPIFNAPISITGSGFEAWQDMECKDCKKGWKDIYKLVSAREQS